MASEPVFEGKGRATNGTCEWALVAMNCLLVFAQIALLAETATAFVAFKGAETFMYGSDMLLEVGRLCKAMTALSTGVLANTLLDCTFF